MKPNILCPVALTTLREVSDRIAVLLNAASVARFDGEGSRKLGKSGESEIHPISKPCEEYALPP